MAIALGGKSLVPAAGEGTRGGVPSAAARAVHQVWCINTGTRPEQVFAGVAPDMVCAPSPFTPLCPSGALLPSWLGDADWRKRHGALICLAQVGGPH